MALFSSKHPDPLAIELGFSARTSSTNLKIGALCSRKWLMLACELTYQTVSEMIGIYSKHKTRSNRLRIYVYDLPVHQGEGAGREFLDDAVVVRRHQQRHALLVQTEE